MRHAHTPLPSIPTDSNELFATTITLEQLSKEN